MRGTLDQRKAIRLLEAQGWRKTTGGKHQVKIVRGVAGGISLCLDEEPAGPLHLASVTFTDRPLTAA